MEAYVVYSGRNRQHFGGRHSGCGGDFYDFFLTDDDHLAMVMADVSGKGVPAALFMVIAKTLLKNVAQTGLSPRAVLEKVNNQLCVNNEAEMFVTVWLGILEISTGRMICANAGHEYPVLKRADGDYELAVINQVVAFVEEELESAGVSIKVMTQMNIAVDEIFSNIARYSAATSATVGVRVENDIITLRFADNGLPYDPTEKPDPNTALSAEERDIGGLGIFMVKKTMDSVAYEYHDGLNILTLTKRYE